MSFSRMTLPINDMYIKPPCRDCTKETGRYPGCHDHCEKYIDYRRTLEEKKKVTRQARLEKSGLFISFRNKFKTGPSKHSEV